MGQKIIQMQEQMLGLMFFGGNMKKLMIILLFLCILLALPYLFCHPVKVAKKQHDLNSQETYILVKHVSTTASQWEIIGDNEKMYASALPVELKGNYPKVTFDIQWGNNTYVCYGKYNNDIVNFAGYENKVFIATDWDILYPVYHNHIWDWIVFSKHFLFSFELNSK